MFRYSLQLHTRQHSILQDLECVAYDSSHEQYNYKQDQGLIGLLLMSETIKNRPITKQRLTVELWCRPEAGRVHVVLDEYERDNHKKQRHTQCGR